MDKNEILKYHCGGKIGVRITKPFNLNSVYTPGVAIPCLAIKKNPAHIFKYTNRANTVAVISNGTATLGLGDLGPYACKPVMEGKAMLFKKLADIDAWDLEIKETNPQKIVQIIKALSPSFGGINLEDIKAPECFYILEELKKVLDVPIWHDDQDGTAIVVGAAFLNALKLTKKKIDQVKLVITGAGAAGLAVAKFLLGLGLKRKNLSLLEKKKKLNQYQKPLVEKKLSLKEALHGADAFIGLSTRNVLNGPMIQSMGPQPIIFALANPDPEIPYPVAKKARPDALIATGRCDFPNQVNNALAFPGVWRGVLDIHAKMINEEMKKTACLALASLAPFMPKLTDKRVVPAIANAVARTYKKYARKI